MERMRVLLLLFVLAFSEPMFSARSIKQGCDSIAMPELEIILPKIQGERCFLRNAPNGDALLIVDGICMSLNDSASAVLAFPKGIHIDDIFWDENSNCYLSDGNTLFLYNLLTGEAIKMVKLDKPAMRFCGDSKGALFYQLHNQELFSCDYKTPGIYKRWQFDKEINDVKKETDGCVVGYGNRIIIITNSDNFIPIVDSPEKVNVIETTDGGSLFYGTDERLCYIDSSFNRINVVKKGVKSLLYNNNSLYIIFIDNSLARINNISSYHQISDSISTLKALKNISFQASLRTGMLKDCNLLVEAGEISISPNQLCVLPNNGLYLLIGNELISLEENETSPFIRIPEQIIPEDMLFTGTNVFAKNDTTIVSCGKNLTPLCVFDTNQFKMFSTTDDNLFVATKNDSISMLFSCDAANGKVEPFIKIAEDIIYVAGDTTQCILVTTNKIFNIIQKKNVLTLLNYIEPIETATFTNCGLVFSTANNILLLNGQNNVTLIAERGCRRLLSDVDNLYIYYEDGTVLSYSMDLLKSD